jgi:hypothetical protein
VLRDVLRVLYFHVVQSFHGGSQFTVRAGRPGACPEPVKDLRGGCELAASVGRKTPCQPEPSTNPPWTSTMFVTPGPALMALPPPPEIQVPGSIGL